MCKVSTVLRTEIKSMLLHFCACPCLNPNNRNVLSTWFGSLYGFADCLMGYWCTSAIFASCAAPAAGAGFQPLVSEHAAESLQWTMPHWRFLPDCGKMSVSFDVSSTQSVFDRSIKACRRGAVRVCFCSTLAWLLWSSGGGGGVSHQKWDACYLAPHPHPHRFQLAWSCVIMECSLFIRPNLCCRETLGPIQHRRNPFKYHPSVSRIPQALKRDPGSLKCGQAPEPFKVYPMPRARQGS